MAATTTSITAVYPMDSAPPTEWRDGLPVYDRAYNAADLRRFMGRAVTDGVWPDYLDELAVRKRAQTWYVSPGAAMAAGLLIDLAEEAPVIDQGDIASGRYAHVVVAARFDSDHRDAAVYAVVTAEPDYEPERTDSVHELVLARIDWRGNRRDLRMDNGACGPVTAVAQPDTESFMLDLETALSQFAVHVGEVETLAPGSPAHVGVRRPAAAGDPVLLDFGIPRGAKGEAGRDGREPPTVYVRPEGEEPPHEDGVVWLVDDGGLITAIRVYDFDSQVPGAGLFPGPATYPGGEGRWEPKLLSPSVVAGGGGGGGGASLTFGNGAPAYPGVPGDKYIDVDTGDAYVMG